MKCVVCGEELAENALLCPRCGSVVSPAKKCQ
ncbi:zinc-ribbon domain-containing protein [bacterium D16-50]|nr:zinc-ribbon domain-containing protein [bacterium D16-50]